MRGSRRPLPQPAWLRPLPYVYAGFLAGIAVTAPLLPAWVPVLLALGACGILWLMVIYSEDGYL